jgi:tripartite-type tricarboxylate transporter receptor subunit TctC
MGDPEDDDEEEEEEKKKGEEDEEEEENDGEEDEVPWQVTVPDSRGMRATMRCSAPYFPLPPTLCAADSSRITPESKGDSKGIAMRTCWRMTAILGLLLAADAVHAQQNYPARPVRLIVPFPPGGAVDVIGRIVAPRLSERLGQQVVVDNRGGANAIIGTEITARAAPDGYTILIVPAGHAITPSVARKLPYDSMKDFASIGLIGGQISAFFSGVASGSAQIKAGKVRALGVTTTRRTAALPDVPTIAEAGVPGYDFDSWTGFVAPTGTPPAIVAQVHAEAARISKLSDIRERLTAAGFEVVGGSSDAFAALIKSNNARLGKVIRDAGIKAE